MRDYYVYIMTNASHTLYVGVTNSLQRRVWEHKHKALPGFTSRYRIDRLVYYETTTSRESAITREKQLKGLLRRKKVNVIRSAKPRLG